MIIKNGLIEMKKGYWVSLYFKIDNQENLKKYSELATPVIKSYGGVPLIRGGKHDTFNGDDFSLNSISEAVFKLEKCHPPLDMILMSIYFVSEKKVSNL